MLLAVVWSGCCRHELGWHPTSWLCKKAIKNKDNACPSFHFRNFRGRLALHFTAWVEQCAFFCCTQNSVWGSCAKQPLLIIVRVFAMLFLLCCNCSSLGEVDATRAVWRTVLKLLKTHSWLMAQSLLHRQDNTHPAKRTPQKAEWRQEAWSFEKIFSLNLTTDGSGSHMKGYTASRLLHNFSSYCSFFCVSLLHFFFSFCQMIWLYPS